MRRRRSRQSRFVSNLGTLNTGSPTTTVYATLPNTPNANIAFSPSGDMYIWDSGQGAMVTATDGPNPPVVTAIPMLSEAAISECSRMASKPTATRNT